MSSNATKINPYTNKAYSANYFVQREQALALPVASALPDLLSAVANNNVVIVVGETGSGKTTQLPKAVLEQLQKDGRRLAVTQNRRLAAQLVAARIAEEMDVPVGTVVGLRHRGCDLVSKATRLEVVTDGSLIMAAKADPKLTGYSAIVIDEAHEHSVATDLLLGLLKELAVQRHNDLKIIIMSATIDADLFGNFFPGSVVKMVSGREHKVLLSYLASPAQSSVDTIVETILQVHMFGRSGNILVFAPGVGEIFKIIKMVEEALGGTRTRLGPEDVGPMSCWPLHATLSPDAQERAVHAVAPARCNGRTGRKLIVATNIAETSITLTGVTHVIDSCKVKSKIWNVEDESWCLREQWVSKAAARQRAGRAGRTREGMAYRMCTEGGFHEQMLEHSVPAIIEGDMLRECLDILKMGRSPLTFPYIIAPATETIVKALSILRQLGAIDAKGESLTLRGMEITRLPVDVYSAVPAVRLLGRDAFLDLDMEASEGGKQLFLTAFTDEEKAQIAKIRNYFKHPSGDHLTLFNIYTAWRSASSAGTADAFLKENKLLGAILKSADSTRLQLLRILNRHESWTLRSMSPLRLDYYILMLKALAAGNYLRVAKRESKSEPKKFSTLRHSAVARVETDLGPPSGANEWLMYNEYASDGNTKRFLRCVSAIPPECLVSAQPGFWRDPEFLPHGHIRDSLVKVIANMTGGSEDFIRGGMPDTPSGTS
ncbi:DEAH-box ATP-dependent RNA helicase prp43 [Friedmanniomyces endolithicus]|nr:DEAH-box ATP-dependent RNA helicase prp43 [Friedmanniomyces endolithicus]